MPNVRAREARVCQCSGHAFVSITGGGVVLADVGDKKLLESRSWSSSLGYATSSRGKLHRHILAAELGQWVDHANGDRLDNRRSNLRFCTPSQNLQNKKKTGRGGPPLSPYKGVTFFVSVGRWAARISLNRKRVFLGYFDTDAEAARAYDRAAATYFGAFAKFNFPGEVLCRQ